MDDSIELGIVVVIVESHLRGCREYAREMASLGMRVGLKKMTVPSRDQETVIGIGVSVACELVVPIIQKATAKWPQLCHLVLSSDLARRASEARHYQIIIGDRSSKSVARIVKPWSVDEIDELSSSLHMSELHAKVRSKYRANSIGSVVCFVGGPLDGCEEVNLEPAGELAVEVVVPGGVTYKIDMTSGNVVYRAAPAEN